jgi:hypothetical protein
MDGPSFFKKWRVPKDAMEARKDLLRGKRAFFIDFRDFDGEDD